MQRQLDVFLVHARQLGRQLVAVIRLGEFDVRPRPRLASQDTEVPQGVVEKTVHLPVQAQEGTEFGALPAEGIRLASHLSVLAAEGDKITKGHRNSSVSQSLTM